MKVGSLVMNKSSQYLGIVLRVHGDDVRIHWFSPSPHKNPPRLWSRYSHNLEVLCE